MRLAVPVLAARGIPVAHVRRQQLLHERERLLHLLQHPDHPVVLVHVGDGALQGQLGAELDAGRVLTAEVGLKRRKAA